MKKEATKELGKFILDITKIVIAIVVITPTDSNGYGKCWFIHNKQRS